MGDYFTMLADTDVTLGEAPTLSAAVIAHLQDHGIIIRDRTTDDLLVGTGYLPGPKIGDVYQAPNATQQFYGGTVAPKTERHFNYWAYGPACCGVTCPKCGTQFSEDLAAFGDTFADAIGEWMDQSGDGLLSCPACSKDTLVTDWNAKNPLAFCNFSLTFWNWPPFDRPEWMVDIPGLLREITGHTIVSSFGKV